MTYLYLKIKLICSESIPWALIIGRLQSYKVKWSMVCALTEFRWEIVQLDQGSDGQGGNELLKHSQEVYLKSSINDIFPRTVIED